MIPSPKPVHISIIMDGNRRWAKRHHMPVKAGHAAGALAALNVIEAALEYQIKVLTLFAFSTENWMRDPQEVESLMDVACDFLTNITLLIQKRGIRLFAIGDLEALPSRLYEKLHNCMALSSQGSELDVVLAINYGGRHELTRAFHALQAKITAGVIDPSSVAEKEITAHLDTARWPDPDLLIRTSGEKRLSNFLIWQHAYTECCFLEVLWPDFSKSDLVTAINEFALRQRRYGGSG